MVRQGLELRLSWLQTFPVFALEWCVCVHLHTRILNWTLAVLSAEALERPRTPCNCQCVS